MNVSTKFGYSDGAHEWQLDAGFVVGKFAVIEYRIYFYQFYYCMIVLYACICDTLINRYLYLIVWFKVKYTNFDWFNNLFIAPDVLVYLIIMIVHHTAINQRNIQLDNISVICIVNWFNIIITLICYIQFILSTYNNVCDLLSFCFIRIYIVMCAISFKI